MALLLLCWAAAASAQMYFPWQPPAPMYYMNPMAAMMNPRQLQPVALQAGEPSASTNGSTNSLGSPQLAGSSTTTVQPERKISMAQKEADEKAKAQEEVDNKKLCKILKKYTANAQTTYDEEIKKCDDYQAKLDKLKTDLDERIKQYTSNEEYQSILNNWRTSHLVPYESSLGAHRKSLEGLKTYIQDLDGVEAQVDGGCEKYLLQASSKFGQ